MMNAPLYLLIVIILIQSMVILAFVLRNKKKSIQQISSEETAKEIHHNRMSPAFEMIGICIGDHSRVDQELISKEMSDIFLWFIQNDLKEKGIGLLSKKDTVKKVIVDLTEASFSKNALEKKIESLITDYTFYFNKDVLINNSPFFNTIEKSDCKTKEDLTFIKLRILSYLYKARFKEDPLVILNAG